MLLLGLAPAAHGANRTGRMFTGDRSGDFLFGALRAPVSPTSRSRRPRRRPRAERRLDHRRLCAARRRRIGRCRPSATHACRGACASSRLLADGSRDRLPWRVRLGRGAAAGQLLPRPRARSCRARDLASGTARELPGEPYTLLGCYHPSQQNTFTGRLTEPMIDEVLERARRLADDHGNAAAPVRGRASAAGSGGAAL